MIKIGVFRIDDRLIHGQIVTAWSGESGANIIVVADDKAAQDSFTQSLLEMATPSGMKLKIFSITDAISFLNNPESEGIALLLVKSPTAVLEMFSLGFTYSPVNVGNMGMKQGKTKLATTLWVNEEETAAFKALHEKGVALELRAVPRDKSINVLSLL